MIYFLIFSYYFHSSFCKLQLPDPCCNFVLLAYDLMKDQIAELKASNEYLKKDILHLKAAMRDQDDAAIRTLHKKTEALEKSMAELRQWEQERDRFLQDRESFIEGLEKELASYKSEADSFKLAHEESVKRLTQLEEGHCLGLDTVKQASFKEGRSKGVRKGLELGAMVGAHRCRS